MRQFVFMKGAPGSGKSTFINNQGLTPFAVSPDDIRLYIGGLESDLHGNYLIDQNYKTEVWQLVYEILERTMYRGEFIILDSTMQQSKDFTMPLKLIEKYKYQPYCIDLSTTDYKLVCQRNLNRAAHKIAPENILSRIYQNCLSYSIPNTITKIKSFNEILKPTVDDLSQYKKIHHIGDLHGNYSLLNKHLNYKNLNSEEYYIFVGDYFDRGLEIERLAAWIKDNIFYRENVTMLYGNHEYHIQDYVLGKPCKKNF